jgi:hypothetical protein
MNTRMRTATVVMAGAAMLAAGGGAAALASAGPAPAAAHAPAATGFSWHPLHLINGWKADMPRYFGTPAYAVHDGVLYLRGALIPDRASPSIDMFAVLPAGLRPSHYLWISCANSTVAMTGTATGSLAISPGGDMLITVLTSNARPSLSGISFPLSS